MSKSQKFFIDRQESLGKLNGYVEEMYSGHEVVRISRGADNVKKHFGGLNEAVYNANWKSQFLSGIMQPLMNVIGNLALRCSYAFLAQCLHLTALSHSA